MTSTHHTDLRGRTSPFHDLLGFHMTEFAQGQAVIVCDLAERHMNRNGFVHGGVLTALLDEIGAAAGAWTPVPGHVRRTVTVTLACSFLGRARHGRIVGTGTLVSHGRQTFFSRCEVRDEAGTLIAMANGSYRWRGEMEITPPPDQPAPDQPG
jgi:uncharacterized protein (TIGR00369 family)